MFSRFTRKGSLIVDIKIMLFFFDGWHLYLFSTKAFDLLLEKNGGTPSLKLRMVPKIGVGKPPKMDGVFHGKPYQNGVFHGKPYEQMDDLGGPTPLLLETPLTVLPVCR